MRTAELLWRRYRYLPYEREFARRELEALAGSPPTSVADGLLVHLNGHPVETLERLTYFAEARLSTGERLVPLQARLEMASNVDDPNGRRRGSTRQATRYSAHGLHEYRGKFNPQVVRSIGNMLGLSAGAAVLDPFCGSGTTLLESAHAGWNAIGLDLNPLAVEISNAKLAAIRSTPGALREAVDSLSTVLLQRAGRRSYEKAWSEAQVANWAGRTWKERIPNYGYLENWFEPSVLGQFGVILEEIDRLQRPSLARVFRVVLSDLVRASSRQDPGDLRIRRRKDAAANYPVIPWFVESLNSKARSVITARRTIGRIESKHCALVADSRQDLPQVSDWAPSRQFDAVITSPPYATALPYIDTQRLSLCLLGLIASDELPEVERALIGTREITKSGRRELERELQTCGDDIAPSVAALARKMLRHADNPADGFRKKNMPTLVYQYFRDMGQVMRNVHALVAPGAAFALVVGRNRTVLGGTPFVVDTPTLLADTAELAGWSTRSTLELDTYQRFDMHRRNSIDNETLVVLERRP